MTLVDSLRNVQTEYAGRKIPVLWATIKRKLQKTFTDYSAAFRLGTTDLGNGPAEYAFSSWNRRPDQDSKYTNYWRSL